MEKEIVTKETMEISLPDITATDVKKFFCANATDTEIAMFLNIAKMNGLNPFKREIYLIKYGDNPAQNVTGYETYLKRAERSNKYAGFKVWIEGKVPEMKSCIEVYRKDWDKPLYHEVEYTEYVGKKKDGSVTRFWNEKPKTMLKKVCISQALRFAFPDELGGMPYTQEELNIIDIQSEEKNPALDTTDSGVLTGASYVENVTPSQKEEKEVTDTASDKQQKCVYAIMKSQGHTDEEIKEVLQTKFGISSTRSLTKKQASLLIDSLQGKK